MNIHYAFSIRSDGGDDDSDDDEDVDKGDDNADDDGEDENLFFFFQGSQRGRGQRSNIAGYLVLEMKTDAEKKNIREGYMEPTWYALAGLKICQKIRQPNSLGQKFYTLQMRT